MHVKTLSRLSDWFDCLVVLSTAAPSRESRLFADGFAEEGWVWIQGASIPFRSAARQSDQLSEAAGPFTGAEGADRLHAWLHARHLKRPLFWVESAGFEDLLRAFPHAFTARLEGYGDVGGETADGPGLVLGELGADDEAGKAAWLKDAQDRIRVAVQTLLEDDKALNVLVLYDDQFTYVSTIFEHLTALKQYSRHNIYFLPGSNQNGHYQSLDRWPDAWDLSVFDAVIWHYSIRAAHELHIYDALAQKLARFTGLKVLFIQDEYDDLHITWRWMRRVGINLVMTCAPNMASARGLYPEHELPSVETLLTLTGYVPEDQIEQFYTPLEERSLRIAYRGRTLPYQYGTLGQEKYSIGVDMRRLARDRGVAVDIEVDEDSRIYGDDWYRFMGSARATLASESGSLAADFDGELKHKAARAMAAGQPFDEFREAHLLDLEGIAPINVVSPKIFEAIRLRTALICFEGAYSGVIQPDRHYIPLKKDFSNVDEVLAKLEDLDLLRSMTERAYADVIETGAYSYRTFVKDFDNILSGRALRPWRTEIISAPVARRDRGSSTVRGIPYRDSIEYALNAAVLRKGYQAPELAAAVAALYDKVEVFYERRGLMTYRMERPAVPPADAFRFWRIGPDALTVKNAWLADGARLTLGQAGALVETTDKPGRYTAMASVDLAGPDFAEEFCWIRVAVRDVRGELRICLFDEARDDVGPELAVPAGDGLQEVYFVLERETSYSALVFRSSEFAGAGEPAGSGVFVEAEMLVASQYELGVQAVVRKMLANPRGSLRSQLAPPPPAPLEAHPPHLPPPGLQVRQTIAPSDLYSIEYWRNRGAATEPRDNGTHVLTPPAAWTYAAGAALDLDQVSFGREACWVKVTLDGVKGAVQLGLSNAEGNRYAFEINVPQMTAPGVVYVQIKEPIGNLLLFRTGPLDQAGEAVFLGAELLAGPAPGVPTA